MNKQFEHFKKSQDLHWDSVIKELSNGTKESHWMWFVFPQIKGLGNSPTAITYALNSIEEAKMYYQDEILGKRLIDTVNLMLNIESNNLTEILAFPDDLKFISSMTLFSLAVPDNHIFNNALKKYNNGNIDEKTFKILDIKVDSDFIGSVPPKETTTFIEYLLKFLKLK